jgi:hypothetical protein
MDIFITIIYVLGCLVAVFMVDMIETCYVRNKIDIKIDSAMACIFGMGSWLAAWYIWNHNKKEIMWTWNNWRNKYK